MSYSDASLFFESFWTWTIDLFRAVNFRVFSLSDGLNVYLFDIVFGAICLFIILKYFIFRH